jgi:hypothetical protein
VLAVMAGDGTTKGEVDIPLTDAQVQSQEISPPNRHCISHHALRFPPIPVCQASTENEGSAAIPDLDCNAQRTAERQLDECVDPSTPRSSAQGSTGSIEPVRANLTRHYTRNKGAVAESL